MAYVIGVDFGTLSGRAVLVNAENGFIAAQCVADYPHGVDTTQGPGWALQDPMDYLVVLEKIIPPLLVRAGILPQEVAGIGWDVTSCTMLPALADGTPLCNALGFEGHPHARIKLWKHLAASPQARRIEEAAQGTGLLDRFGGKVSSQWMLPKVLQILEEAPEVYEAADLFLEVADWLTYVLTGSLRRNSCCAGFKAFWEEETGYPQEFFAGLDPRLSNLSRKLRGTVLPPWEAAGKLNEEWARRLGLLPGTLVSAGVIDAHAGLPGSGVAQSGTLLMAMGTSTCHMIFDEKLHTIPGICGTAKDSVLPGLWAYEAGQACVGDLLDWFVKNQVPARETERAGHEGLDIHQYLSREASELPPGSGGLLALDWWNGQRSPYVDDRLKGMMLGLTIRTTPAQQYRALMEATAYGTRLILETFEKGGVEIRDVTACGGISQKNPLMLQIYADVLGRPIRIAREEQTTAFGAAILAAAAAGVHEAPAQAVRAMTAPPEIIYFPDTERGAQYDALYAEYRTLAEYFSGINQVMHRL